MRQRSLRFTLLPVGTLAFVTLVWACGGNIGSGSGNSVAFQMPECPHDWTDANRRGATLGANAIAGPLTDVPEFHDCQRLIVSSSPESPLRYGPLAAVFVRYKLDSSYADTAPASEQTLEKGLAVGEVLAESSYVPLSIRPGFNCLFLRLKSPAPGVVVGANPAFEAWMVYVGQSSDAACRAPFATLSPYGPRQVPVTYVAAPSGGSFTADSVPPVARWEWDERNRQQVIIVKCPPRGWCEIHAPGAFNGTQPPKLAPSSSGIQGRVARIKGWYDEQYLAELGAANGPLRPGAVRGTVFPDPDLANYQMTTYQGTRWLPVARVLLDHESKAYESKLNFGAATVKKQLNEVSLCRGDWKGKCGLDAAPSSTQPPCSTSADGSTWYAMVRSTGSAIQYYCVTYRKIAVDVGTLGGYVRWRWKPKDETLWVWCPLGCCEVIAGS